MGLFEKIFGTHSDKVIKSTKATVAEINALEPTMAAKSDAELRGMTAEFKKRLAGGEDLDDILPEAYAVVREAAKRVLGQRHYDVQLIGGIVLNNGSIAEMKTGEGKTLVSTLPAYLNALEGKGVHIVTVNDYLAKRDSAWMGKIYNFLGLTVGTIVHDLSNDERRAAYACDITYATNNELGFDYLRDNMVIYKSQLVQRELHYAIVDEVDSILIDEARTPLIISGAGNKSSELYERANAFARNLSKKVVKEAEKKSLMEDVTEDYIVDEKARTATLTPYGVKKAEAFFKIDNLSDPENAEISHHINQAIRAHGVMKRDIDYVVKDNSVIIVDEFTGRLMFGRRYNEGLHQAIEAKEGVKIEKESMTQATITFQNFFRMYDKLSGMTGTALTEEGEFNNIYNLDVVAIPTNRPMIRIDYPDAVYKTVNGKYKALIEDVIAAHEKGQPVLIGTVSIEKSEHLSTLLTRRGIKHNVLNAKNHEKEAEIVAQAGKYGAVTIATNMAGRGTDIMLGGNASYMAKQELKKMNYSEELINQSDGFDETDDQEINDIRQVYRDLTKSYAKQIEEERKKVVEAGGLFIMGTERHESRRIDNQLRGRSGRQGDPGMSRFYLSLEDDLMRLFGGDKIYNLIDALKIPEDEAISHTILSNTIESAQKKVESRNFDIRKNVLEYDDVMNQQRNIIYSQRRRVLDGENLKDTFMQMLRGRIAEEVESVCRSDIDRADWSVDSLKDELVGINTKEEISDALSSGKKADKISEELFEKAKQRYEEKEAEIGSDLMREVERVFLLRAVDENWMTHIDAIDQLKYGVGLQAYGNKDPLVEYKIQTYDMFEELNRAIRSDALRMVLSVRINNGQNVERKRVTSEGKENLSGGAQRAQRMVRMSRESHAPEAPQQAPKETIKKDYKVGRNEKCPCGSGKKYKDCCGAKKND